PAGRCTPRVTGTILPARSAASSWASLRPAARHASRSDHALSNMTATLAVGATREAVSRRICGGPRHPPSVGDTHPRPVDHDVPRRFPAYERLISTGNVMINEKGWGQGLAGESRRVR